MRIDKNTTIKLGDRNIVRIKIGDSVIWEKQQDNIDYLYIQNTYSGSNTITFTTTQSGTPASGTYATSVECSKDKLTWNTINFDTLNPQTITLEQGEKLYLRNNTGVFNFHDVRNGTVDYYTSITSTNTINVGGNTNSLFDYTNMSGVDVSSTVGGLFRLFNQSVNLVNAKDIVIPQTTYPDFFLGEMFNHCESLVTTPNLNNVVNIGYASCSQMFGYCYSLVTPPDFNGVTYTGIRGGFSWCFHDCNSLTRTPSFNSLTSIGPYGFNQAFTNCSNLTDIMFDTSNITSLPESAFNMSFTNTKIETGLHLGNVTELGKASLYKLYANCSFLSAVYCPNVSSWDESKTRNWLSGAGTSVSGTKTAYKYSDISIPTSDSGIPTGWTIVKPDYLYVENTYNGSNTISVKQTITGQPDSSLYSKTLQYSKDKTNWSTITLSSTAYNINLNQGERVYFRGNEGLLNYYANDGAIQAVTNILGIQTHVIGGNINTLVNYITPNELTLTQGVFAGLFQNNTTITSAENLTLPPSSDGSLPTFAYYLMFSGCSALITSPSEIPATKQGHASCSKMFLDCTQLKTPPALKSTILGNYCFTSIFKNCTSLISAPELPALTLASNCYHSAFFGCTSLVNPPELPAVILADSCYYSMFEGCSKLVNPPELPATEMKPNCYRSLFYKCTSLVNVPKLPAKVLAEGCYLNIFRNCPKINNITVYADDISATDCTKYWLSGVASTGTFNNYGSATYTINSASGIPTGWVEKKPDYLYVENTYNGSNTISVKQTITGQPDSSLYSKTLQYSKDKTNWSTITLSSTAYNITLNQGEKVYFRGNEGVLNYHANDAELQAITNILGTQSHTIGGNINTLVNYITPNELTLTQGVFALLFQNNTTITSAENLTLPATQMAQDCYRGLFYGCSSLTSMPELPATELAPNCYRAMLANCTSLTTSKKLPATKLSTDCYRELFFKCSSLVNPPELPAEILAEGCYRALFFKCTSLNNVTVYADDISATDCTTNWLSGVASSGTFNNMGSATYTPNSPSGIPTGWVEVKS